ncbi:MAG: SDR family oxidoreductase [Desulfovibrionaceae bacterium]|nr:SDR family oxidoreductase [Desulfovibrionaceae bacterium]
MTRAKESIKNVLVTGNMGYIGCVLTPELAGRGCRVIGYDTGFFGPECQVCEFDPRVERQIMKDTREAAPADFEGADAVIHLAALSNDPLGELAPEMTEEINYQATMRLAEAAKKAGVRRFVYASSQSMYGVSDTSRELDEDNSEKNPVTAYAKTKWRAECDLNGLSGPGFMVTHFRPSTVFGPSPRLRCDIVYNNLLACAFTTGGIEIKSDGTPWRPVIHIKDVCAAFIAGLTADRDLLDRQAFNIGIKDGNYTVRRIAEAAQRAVPGSTLVFTGEHGPDSRTYRVGFNKILTRLKDHFRPEWDLASGGRELVGFFQKVGLTEDDFRGQRCNRLPRLKALMAAGDLDHRLRWRA